MKLGAAIVIGATLISLAIIFGGRYEMVPMERVGILHLDSLTGQLLVCQPRPPKVVCYDRDGLIQD